MSVGLYPPMTAPRKRGRPPGPHDPEKARENHIACAVLIALHGATVTEAMEAFRRSERTILYWRKAGLSYDDPRSKLCRRRLGLPDPD